MCTPGHVIIEIKAISKWNEEKVHFKKKKKYVLFILFDFTVKLFPLF